jgi:glutamate synthase domain-containing protein 1
MFAPENWAAIKALKARKFSGYVYSNMVSPAIDANKDVINYIYCEIKA